MLIQIDSDTRKLTICDKDDQKEYGLYTKSAFDVISQLWLKLSWDQKYSYTFTWLGRPIIQHPEDIVRMQEVIFRLRPDIIIETGVAHGGSLVFMASILSCLGNGRVVGVDVEIRPHNRIAIEAHPLAHMISLIEGDSIAPETVRRVSSLIGSDDVVLVILDSDHSKQHVAAELEAYHGLVSVDSYIVATDGIMATVWDTPRGQPHWRNDNPIAAVHEFLVGHNDFVLDEPIWLFNESALDKPITGFPDAWLKRIR